MPMIYKTPSNPARGASAKDVNKPDAALKGSAGGHTRSPSTPVSVRSSVIAKAATGGTKVSKPGALASPSTVKRSNSLPIGAKLISPRTPLAKVTANRASPPTLVKKAVENKAVAQLVGTGFGSPGMKAVAKVVGTGSPSAKAVLENEATADNPPAADAVTKVETPRAAVGGKTQKANGTKSGGTSPPSSVGKKRVPPAFAQSPIGKENLLAIPEWEYDRLTPDADDKKKAVPGRKAKPATVKLAIVKPSNFKLPAVKPATVAPLQLARRASLLPTAKKVEKAKPGHALKPTLGGLAEDVEEVVKMAEAVTVKAEVSAAFLPFEDCTKQVVEALVPASASGNVVIEEVPSSDIAAVEEVPAPSPDTAMVEEVPVPSFDIAGVVGVPVPSTVIVVEEVPFLGDVAVSHHPGVDTSADTTFEELVLKDNDGNAGETEFTVVPIPDVDELTQPVACQFVCPALKSDSSDVAVNTTLSSPLAAIVALLEEAQVISPVAETIPTHVEDDEDLVTLGRLFSNTSYDHDENYDNDALDDDEDVPASISVSAAPMVDDDDDDHMPLIHVMHKLRAEQPIVKDVGAARDVLPAIKNAPIMSLTAVQGGHPAQWDDDAQSMASFATSVSCRIPFEEKGKGLLLDPNEDWTGAEVLFEFIDDEEVPEVIKERLKVEVKVEEKPGEFVIYDPAWAPQFLAGSSTSPVTEATDGYRSARKFDVRSKVPLPKASKSDSSPFAGNVRSNVPYKQAFKGDDSSPYAVDVVLKTDNVQIDPHATSGKICPMGDEYAYVVQAYQEPAVMKPLKIVTSPPRALKRSKAVHYPAKVAKPAKNVKSLAKVAKPAQIVPSPTTVVKPKVIISPPDISQPPNTVTTPPLPSQAALHESFTEPFANEYNACPLSWDSSKPSMSSSSSGDSQGGLRSAWSDWTVDSVETSSGFFKVGSLRKFFTRWGRR